MTSSGPLSTIRLSLTSSGLLSTDLPNSSSGLGQDPDHRQPPEEGRLARPGMSPTGVTYITCCLVAAVSQANVTSWHVHLETKDEDLRLHHVPLQVNQDVRRQIRLVRYQVVTEMCLVNYPHCVYLTK